MEKEPTKTWQVAMRGTDGEWDITTLHSYDHTKNVPENPFITQAAPTKITPSRAKPVERDHEVIGIVPDIQYGYRHLDSGWYEPLHDEQALYTTRDILRDIRPDTIVFLGDNLDLPNLSKYEADSQHFSNGLQLALNGLHRYLASIRADHPEANIHYLAGNHEARLAKTVLRHAAQLSNIKPANVPESWNVLSVPYLLRLDELNINYHGGYPANEYQHNDDILFVHGTSVRSSGSTAELYSRQYPDTNVFFGHVHRMELHTRTARNGRYLISATFGTLARTDGIVPSYHNGVDDMGNPVKRQENWQQGVGIVRVYDDGLEVNQIFIRNGQANYGGKTYGKST